MAVYVVVTKGRRKSSCYQVQTHYVLQQLLNIICILLAINFSIYDKVSRGCAECKHKPGFHFLVVYRDCRGGAVACSLIVNIIKNIGVSLTAYIYIYILDIYIIGSRHVES